MAHFQPQAYLVPTQDDPNRRRAARHRSASDRLMKVTLDGTEGDHCITCVVDYSLHGAGLIHPAELPVGTRFHLEIEAAPGRPENRRLLRVSRCTPMEGGRFLIGAEYLNE